MKGESTAGQQRRATNSPDTHLTSKSHDRPVDQESSMKGRNGKKENRGENEREDE